jgi:MFS family permease
MLGNQFFFVALTWLLLQLTDSGALLGSVLMVGAIPRMGFMLVGGAVVDRWAPPPVLRILSLLVTGIVATLALLLGQNALEIWHVFVIALLIGLSDAFFYPAATAMVPKMMGGELLHSANALVQSVDQITQVGGPALAGFLIATAGLPGAFAVNAALFALGALLLWLLRSGEICPTPPTSPAPLLPAIVAGLRYAWRDPAIRVSLFIIAMLNFALVGPMTVGSAALAEARLGGAGAYGGLMAALGVGALAGTLAAGAWGRHFHPKRLLIALSVLLALSAGGLAFASTLIWAIFCLGVMGLGIGFTSVVATTWLQSRAVAQMQGRLMSVLSFSTVVFDPFSQGLAGILLDVGLAPMFLTAAAVMLITAAVAAVIDH